MAFHPDDLFVSPAGNDTWSGRLAAPNADNTDGPLATVARARDLVRERKERGELCGPLTVWLRGGEYPLAAPITFGPEDAGPITYAAYPGETPIINGGRRITGWQIGTRNGHEEWTVQLPEVAAGEWYFRSLYIDGARRWRARAPKVGIAPEQRHFFQIKAVPGHQVDEDLFNGAEAFIAEPGDIDPSWDLTDADVVALHVWVESRLPVKSYDPETGLITSTHRTFLSLSAGGGLGRWCDYYLENIFAALSEPGEWYLERKTGILHYLPFPGETPETTEVYAPVVEQFMRMEGEPEHERYVEYLAFHGLTFAHADWHLLGGGRHPHSPDNELDNGVDYGGVGQAAHHLPGALHLRGARNCVIDGCTVRNVGFYGIDIQHGCRGNRITHCRITDLGGGGVKINGADANGPQIMRTGATVVSDNEIVTGGRVFHSAVGVLIMNGFGNRVEHNEIADLFYSGVSCGWVWAFTENISTDNRIAHNHIHHLGYAWLSDMGGIYLLGVQPGTVLINNLIHDVEKRVYGGWGIYLDAGGSHILIEKNITYRTGSQGLLINHGRENVVRNNIFAFGREGQVSLGYTNPAFNAFTLERNILLVRDELVYAHGYLSNLADHAFRSDCNLLWSVTGSPLQCGGLNTSSNPGEAFSLDAWLALGYDRHTLIADPRCRDIANDDFTLDNDSPAITALGFQPIDMSDVGPRGAMEASLAIR